ncbi:MAG: redoxin domain-containing protein [Candidatus Riflebacteria bacterium]|nr:redoxin domain-containing protein [Candidatus Riflebacteria bacterium]
MFRDFSTTSNVKFTNCIQPYRKLFLFLIAFCTFSTFSTFCNAQTTQTGQKITNTQIVTPSQTSTSFAIIASPANNTPANALPESKQAATTSQSIPQTSPVSPASPPVQTAQQAQPAPVAQPTPSEQPTLQGTPTSQLASGSSKILKPGQIAPKCTLSNLLDTKIIFPTEKKWNLVLFWSLFCHSCLEEIPQICEEMAKKSDPALESYFVSIDTSRMKKGIKNFVSKRGIKSEILLDEIASQSYFAADLWGVKTTPSVFLVDPGGKIVFSCEGPFDPEKIWNELKSPEKKQ